MPGKEMNKTLFQYLQVLHCLISLILLVFNNGTNRKVVKQEVKNAVSAVWITMWCAMSWWRIHRFIIAMFYLVTPERVSMWNHMFVLGNKDTKKIIALMYATLAAATITPEKFRLVRDSLYTAISRKVAGKKHKKYGTVPKSSLGHN